jgi:glucokinase
MTPQDDGPLVLGIDLGGTKILAGVVRPDNRVIGRAKRSTPAQEGGPAIVEAIAACADEALDSAGFSRAELAAVGVGSPGPLDSEAGVILFSANLNVKNFPLGSQLSAKIGCPVLVQNDVRVGGYGEYRLGTGRGYHDLIVAFVGTGIGGCVILRGEIVTGSTGNAGELGHIIIKAGGPRCGCGRRGCMEAFASKTAIARRVDKAVQKGRTTILAEKMARKGGRLKSGDLAEAVAAKDPVALKEVKRAAHFLGIGLGGLINVLGPELVIIGGGVTGALGQPFVDLVRSAARTQALTDPRGTIPIERASLGDNAGILGAALLAREQFVCAPV